MKQSALGVWLVMISIGFAGCDDSPLPVTTVAPAAGPVAGQRTVFSERADATGLDFVHDPGLTGEHFFPEIMGAGVALVDYDNDGDLDVYLIQSGRFDGSGAGNRFFVNQLVPSGKLRFVDRTTESGLGDTGYGMGVAVGDIDNDGYADLYVTNVGANKLFRNNGDGGFETITPAQEAGSSDWSTSASFTDYDRDGDLDLYVANYVNFAVTHNVPCKGHRGERDYCDPLAYTPLADVLWRNDGPAGFVDVSKAAGIHAGYGTGLGVIAADLNGDGWPDFYVANDKMANQLWINQRNGTFSEEALISGCAYNIDGVAEASMGITAGDYDNDGDPDLFMTHLGSQTNTLYRNDGRGNFADISDLARLSVPSLGFTGFGTRWADIDHDGYLDLYAANGAVQIEPTQAAVDAYPYRQTNQLFMSQKATQFSDMSAHSGAPLGVSEVSRGAAFGDIDNDGDIDIVVTNNNGPVRLLINEIGTDARWLTLKLVASGSARDATGARVALLARGQPVAWRHVHTDGSYLSAADPRVHFGLGGVSVADGIRVTWPSGLVEQLPLAGVNRQLTIIEPGASSQTGADR